MSWLSDLPEELRKELLDWCDWAERTDITYHRARRELWDALSKMQRQQPRLIRLLVPATCWNSIKSALTSRNLELSDDKRLAFDTAVQEVVERLVSIEEEPEALPLGGVPLAVKRSEAFRSLKPASPKLKRTPAKKDVLDKASELARHELIRDAEKRGDEREAELFRTFDLRKIIETVKDLQKDNNSLPPPPEPSWEQHAVDVQPHSEEEPLE